MQGMQQAEKGDGIQAKEDGMTTDYPPGGFMATPLNKLAQYWRDDANNADLALTLPQRDAMRKCADELQQSFAQFRESKPFDWLEELTAMVANLADRVPKEPVVPLEGVLNFVTLVATDTRGLRHEYIESRSGSMVRVPDFHGLQLRHNT